MKEQEGVHVQFETDSDGKLDRIFFEMKGSAEKLARGFSPESEKRTCLILFDTTVSELAHIYLASLRYMQGSRRQFIKTNCFSCCMFMCISQFNTNSQGLKLGCLTSVDENGHTYIVAVSLLMHEDLDSFKWVFRQFKHAFGVEPTCIYTDSDPAMRRAIVEELPSAAHFLCTFHLSMNLTTNVKRAFQDGKGPLISATVVVNLSMVDLIRRFLFLLF